MNIPEMFDFSKEGDFQETLLRKIKAECFSEISDDDLEYVNAAAGRQLPDEAIRIILRDQQ